MTIVKLVKKNNYTYCIFYNFIPQTVIPALIFKLLTQKPIVLEYEDDYSFFRHNKYYKYFNKFFLRISKKLLNGVICVNNKMLDQFRFLKNKTVIRGIFEPMFYKRLHLKNSTNIPKIMFSGSLNDMRGIDVFISALEKVKNRVEVIITGKGPLENLVYKGTKNPLVKLRYYGHIPYEEYVELLKESDIAISCYKIAHPMNNHIFPSKIIEYMAYGKIVITSKVSDIDTLKGKDIFLMYENDSPDSLANVIDTVVSNINYYRIYAKNARNWVKENCSTDALSVIFLNYFDFGKE
jgi:glycosyltransferase involved in cell wall biosynthesis